MSHDVLGCAAEPAYFNAKAQRGREWDAKPEACEVSDTNVYEVSDTKALFSRRGAEEAEPQRLFATRVGSRLRRSREPR